eukprot:6488569-Amphidinium_carterae.1
MLFPTAPQQSWSRQLAHLWPWPCGSPFQLLSLRAEYRTSNVALWHEATAWRRVESKTAGRPGIS